MFHDVFHDSRIEVLAVLLLDQVLLLGVVENRHGRLAALYALPLTLDIVLAVLPVVGKHSLVRNARAEGLARCGLVPCVLAGKVGGW